MQIPLGQAPIRRGLGEVNPTLELVCSSDLLSLQFIHDFPAENFHSCFLFFFPT